MSRFLGIAFGLGLLMIGTFALGQEREATPFADRLPKALKELRARKDFVTKCIVTVRKPPRRRGNVEVVVTGPGMGLGEPYEGEVEAWVKSDGSQVFVSKSELPGFEIYVSGKRVVTQTRYEGKPPSFTNLSEDLSSLLNLKRLQTWVDKAQLRARIDEKTGETVFWGRLSARLIRPSPARTGAMFQPHVLRVEARLTLDREGRLAEAEIRVVRSDPFAEIAEEELEREAGASRPKKTSKTEALTSTYRLVFSDKEPSGRAKGFLTTVAGMLDRQEK